jgi:hypothetical protein
MKQKSTAGSPLFWTGKKPFGKCDPKYAAAISPEARNATGRVKRHEQDRAPALELDDPGDHDLGSQSHRRAFLQTNRGALLRHGRGSGSLRRS